MDPVTLIVTALATGASAGAVSALQDDVKEKSRTAYAKLRGLVKKRIAGRPDAELALEHHETAPQKWESMLTAELAEAGAGDDAELVAAAQTLMELMDSEVAKSGKYNVTIKKSRGIQIGDHGFQINTFHE